VFWFPCVLLASVTIFPASSFHQLILCGLFFAKERNVGGRSAPSVSPLCFLLPAKVTCGFLVTVPPFFDDVALTDGKLNACFSTPIQLSLKSCLSHHPLSPLRDPGDFDMASDETHSPMPTHLPALSSLPFPWVNDFSSFPALQPL